MKAIDQLFDIVKVVSFAVSEGAVAIHCHAGLGRTGVICACWLIFDRGLYAEEAIELVRQTRKGSIQTRGQIASVINFGHVFQTLRKWPDKMNKIDYIHKCQQKAFDKHQL